MISAFQYYFPNVLDNINQKHFKQNKTISQSSFEIVKSTLTKQNISFSEGTFVQENIIQKIQIQEKPKMVEVELMIEDKFIGKIIGRGGSNIDQLRKTTNTKIVIYRKLFDTPNAERVSGQGTKRLVVISGKIDCVEHAKNAISEITN